MSAGKPLAYSKWEAFPASNRQRKSPQWTSLKQRHNYYKQYCFWWLDRFGKDLDWYAKTQILFQAIYSPHLMDITGLNRRNPFLDMIGPHQSATWHQPVVLALPYGKGTNET